jgi:hypothetical protein
MIRFRFLVKVMINGRTRIRFMTRVKVRFSCRL